jgi:TRAP-type C4-dicarboxylate transport system permease small subunit
MMEKLAVAYEKLVAGVGNVGMWLTVPLMLIICAEMLLRSTIGFSIVGIHESTEFLLVVFVFLCMGSTYLHKSHVSVTLLTDRFSTRARSITNAATSLLGGLIWAAVAWQTTLHTLEIYRAQVVSPTIGVPYYPFLLITAFGAALIAGALLIESVRRATDRSA